MKIYVVVPRDRSSFAEAVRAAGGHPLDSLQQEVDGHQLARGATGVETLARVRELAASGANPVAMGGLDRGTLRQLAAAGAAGVVLDSALWLLPEFPIGDEDREAIARLTLPDFSPDGACTLPSGLTVGRDVLIAPFVARRATSLAVAISQVLTDLGVTSVDTAPAPVSAPAPAVVPAPTASTTPAASASYDDILVQIVALVSDTTGYPPELLDPTLDMEADLGIDTVKQAELFGTLRTTFGVARDDSVKLKDYSTLAKVAEYMSTQSTVSGRGGAARPATRIELAPSAPVAPPRAVTPTPTPDPAPMPVAAPDPALRTTGEARTEPLEDAVAIIGVGAVMPGAPDAPSFWRNVVAGIDGIIEVPSDRWDSAVHWDAEPTAEDRTYSKIGGFITDFEFDSLKFRIPPNTAKAFDPIQQMALVAASEALADAGYDKRPFDRSRCAVILGNALGGERKDETTKRMHLSEFVAALRATTEWQTLALEQQEALLQQADTDYRAEMPPITEDTMPGELSNIIAGRVANALDLSGKNFTTDAACASSHAALDAAVHAIMTGDADMALWGGADRSMGPDSFVKFSKIGALSPNGSFPFDERADGFVMGEGAAIMLLKRLSLAIADGDKVYAVVRGIGSSSDGAGKGITAPNPSGQKLAIQRAFDAAGVTPHHVQLVEAHGTGTKVGDVVEVSSLADVYEGVPPRSVAIGSIKSQIGHLKSASGAAGLLKAAFSLHEKLLPPTINVTRPTPAIDWDNVPFRINTELTTWPEPAHAEPRRAAVSSFGFGGTNFHVILEEFVPSYHDQRGRTTDASVAGRVTEFADGPTGEMVLIGATSSEALVTSIGESVTRATASGSLATAASAVRTPGGHALPHRLAFVALAHDELVRGLNTAAAMLPDPTTRRGLPLKVKGSALGEGPRAAGKVAFLFPGQGSQYVNMCAELAKRYPVVADTIAEADAVLRPLLGCELSSIMFADAANSEAMTQAEEQLRRTEFTQPAVLVADIAIHRLLLQHGIPCDMVAGHSLGEYAALVAAGVLSFEDALLAVSARGEEMAAVKVDDPGLMASFSCGPDHVDAVLAKVDGYVVAANRNCPVQTVVAGASDPVRKAMEIACAAGIDTMLLNVSAAFHTSIVAPASEPLRKVLDRLTFNPPRIPVYTNVDATPYPADADAQRQILAHQVAAPVEWIAELEALYDAGARTFIEVGPKRALSGFTQATLGDRPDVTTVLTNHPKRGDLASFLDALAQLGSLGFELDLPVAAPTQPATQPRTIDAAARSTAVAPSTVGEATTPTSADRLDFDSFRAAAQPALDVALRQGHELFSREITQLRDQVAAYEARGLHPYDVVVSGAAAGLPGEACRVFDDSNFDRMFAGENRIDRVDAAGIQRILDKNVDRLIKDGGEPRLERANAAGDVLQLAGRRGTLDMVADYGLASRVVDTFDSSTELVVAAAYEALRDAGIPLVQQDVVTQSGAILPGKWALPKEMQDDTGIICGSAFPGLDSFVEELSRSLAHRYAGRTLAALDDFYQELLDVVPPDRRIELRAFYAKNAAELQELVGDERGLEAFSRDFLFRIMSFGHAELSEAILARGPSTQINAACASTTQAIAIAEDWLRTGRCRRVLVVGGDDITSDNLLEWIGTGFLASGAATTASNVEEAALPFDLKRRGMIIGMGAVGLMIERSEDVEERGIVPVARIVSTRIANSAHHRSRLDAEHIAREAKALVETSARFLDVPLDSLASNTLFMSHETYTPARGGSASAEAAALRAAFGPRVGDVLVTNTKGFTGHSMGAGIEDAVAIKSLQFGKIPPIANLSEQDPEFADLQLSRGGAHDRRYAMRFSAGFGSQVALAFFEKLADGPERVADPVRHQAFLDRCSGTIGARTERVGRVLRLAAGAPVTQIATSPQPVPAAAPQAAPTPVPVAATTPIAAVTNTSTVTLGAVTTAVVDLVCEQTGYPAEMLEPDLDLEADLGIDTVKQAEIFSQLRDRYGLERDDSFALKEVATLAKVAEYLHVRIEAGATSPAVADDARAIATQVAPIDVEVPRLPGGVVRRVPRVVPEVAAVGRARPAFVVGDGALAEALGESLPGETGEVAVFLGDDRELFRFAKERVTELESGSLGLLVITHMGGRHGIDVPTEHPEAGAVTGLAKSLAMEFPKAWIRSLDLDAADGIADRQEMVRVELCSANSAHVEIGHSRRDGRVVVKTVAVDDASAAGDEPRVSSDTVLVVTGGARGITADVLGALAARKPTMVLLGRTVVPDLEVPPLDDASLARLREEAKADLGARGERVTPVSIERFLAPHRARAEVAETVRTLIGAGARVEYHSVDVCDETALGNVLADVRKRHGAIHGILHAAGTEESRPLVDKTEEAFERTWAPKAGAALLLARLTRADDLRCFIMFGSVAGRYGNAAQADYSAANDCLAKLAHALRASGVPATTICWGPWGERGMATRGSTLTVLESLGVDSIGTTEGVAAFISELDQFDEAEVVLAKGLGVLGREADTAATAGAPAAAPALKRTLTASDAVMDHHRVEGVPYMAGVLGLHVFSEASDEPVTGYADVHFDYPVKLLRDRPVDVSVHLTASGSATLTTIAPGPLPKPRTHFTADLLTTPPAVATPRSIESANARDFDRIYPPFFHGATFQVLERVTRLSGDGIEVAGRKPEAGLADETGTIEGAVQSLGLWGLLVAGVMALPQRIARIDLHGGYDLGNTTYRVTGARLEDGCVRGDIQCVVDGRVVVELTGAALVVTGSINVDAGPPWWSCDQVSIGPVKLWRVPVEESRLLISRRDLWPGVLGPDEIDALNGLKVAKRREEWLAATLAAKVALRAAGLRQPFPDLQVLRGSDGAPIAHGQHGLTLSHAGGVAIAHVFDATVQRCGVDVEVIEQRSAAFEKEAFTTAERAAFPEAPAKRSTTVTMSWAGKEAVLKALGVGLSVDLHQIQMQHGKRSVSAELAGDVQLRFDALSAETLSVKTKRDGSLVLAWADLRLAAKRS